MRFKKILSIVLCFFMFSVSANTLVKEFEHPDDNYKPWAFWYWINGNVTQAGIRADLESMAEAGLGGVLLMHINEHGMIPQGDVRFLSNEYKSMLKYTFESAAELGLQVNLYNGEGWSVAGGPWITPELGMKELSWNEINTSTTSEVIKFPKPHAPLNYYEDIATLAFPTPSGFIETSFNSSIKTIAVSGTQTNSGVTSGKHVDEHHLVDGDWNTQAYPKTDPITGETYIKFDMQQDYTFRNAFIKFAAYGMQGRNYLMISDDGKDYREVGYDVRGQIYDDIGCFQFEPVTTRHIKFVFKPTDNKLLYTAMPKVSVAVREIALNNRDKIDNWCKKAAHAFPFFNPKSERTTFAQTSESAMTIPLQSIIDVSEHLQADGSLNWTPPSDNWTIIRFGMSSTEAINRPASPGGEGLEVDKMNVNALDRHFQGLIHTAKELAGDQVGKAFASIHADSWEVGRQNWTQDFPEKFEQLRGYSIIKHLPSTLGYTIDNEDNTERFLWDMRKTIADLIAERFYGGMRERANAIGIKFSAQSMKPFIDNLYALGQADTVYANSNFSAIPTSANVRNQKSSYMTAKMTSSAGSIYNRKVSSESLTATPEANRWLNHPEHYKPQVDTDLAAGVTQITHHLFTHQPWLDLSPGMTLGYWGVHFERTQTWWHEISAWNQYLTRSQALLSKGQPVFDILHYLGDDSSTKSDTYFVDELLPEGYDFEFISTHGLLNKLYVNSAKKFAYSSGRQYSILNLADDVSMRPEVLSAIYRFLKSGGVIVGKPPKQSPSLENSIEADAKVAELVQIIWGEQFNKQVFNTIPDALKALNVQPDLILAGTDNKILWRHHQLPDDNTEFYFLANVSAEASKFNAQFRVTGKKPELWDPLLGTRKLISDYTDENGITTIPLTLEQIQSYFVVFSNKETTNELFNNGVLTPVQQVVGPWEVDFIKGVKRPNAIKLAELQDLKDSQVSDVKYFSGTAKYQVDFNFNPQSNTDYILDLGNVHQFARVKLNGIDLGLRMWSPFQYDLKGQLQKGSNSLVVEVTNLWPNRLIGDEREFADTAQWKVNGYQGMQLVDLPNWLKEQGAEAQQPGQRNTFTTWKHWHKNDALVPSGLIGPVKILKLN